VEEDGKVMLKNVSRLFNAEVISVETKYNSEQTVRLATKIYFQKQ